jgi:hypothetical protein
MAHIKDKKIIKRTSDKWGDYYLRVDKDTKGGAVKLPKDYLKKKQPKRRVKGQKIYTNK